MPVITKIETQMKDKERVNVYVDDAFFCGVGLDILIKLNLYKGRELDESQQEDLKRQSGEQDMYAKALDYTLRGLRTKREVWQYLMRKKVDKDVANRITDRLEGGGLINDKVYAETYTGQKGGKLGVGVIRNKLYRRGVSREIIEQATSEISEQEQEQVARQVAEKYMRNKDIQRENLNKLYRHLAGKGFEFDLVATIVGEWKYEDRD